jgi:hypothetical protein
VAAKTLTSQWWFSTWVTTTSCFLSKRCQTNLSPYILGWTSIQSWLP